MSDSDLLQDFYYSDEYIRLYAQEDEEELFEFEYKEGRERFIAKALKRPIYRIGDTVIDPVLYDLNSVYGYQGYRSNSKDPGFIERALKRYTENAVKNRIVAEFMFFHPFNDFPKHFSRFFDYFEAERKYVVANLQTDLFKNYPGRHRSIIRKAARELGFKESEDIEKLIELYRWTMQKNSIPIDPKFSRSFFEKLLSYTQSRLFEVTYENETVSMGVFIYSPPFLHYHVSANTRVGYELNANKLLIHKALEYGAEQGCRYGILGIGRTACEEDTLFRFKRLFSKETLQGYIAGKIFDRQAYDRLCAVWQKESGKESERFLKYRISI